MESEIEEALKLDPEASEKTVWVGNTPTEVAGKLAGGITTFVDQEGYREKWMKAGLAEGSWKTFLEQYCMLKADSVAFTSDDYYRNAEMENLLTLVQILDEEIFSSKAMKGATRLSVSFKSKWWKECHRIFSDAVMEEVYRGLKLKERPKLGLCHTPEWPDALKTAIRKIAKLWVTCPLWDKPQSTDPNTGVDFTSNNEATVKKYLASNKFTTLYLEGRS